MSKDKNLETLLLKSKDIELQEYEVKCATTNIFNKVVEFVKAKSELESKQNRVYEFTPKMLYKIFEINNSKYFADLFWTHSNNPKNLKANPTNEILFTSPRRSVYRLMTKEEVAKLPKKPEVKTS